MAIRSVRLQQTGLLGASSIYNSPQSRLFEANKRMDRRYSPISDMYGVAPDDPSRRRKNRTWLYVLLTIAGYFVFQSIQPVMRLRPNPPQFLIDAKLSPGELAHGSQMKIANSCWNYAIASVQNLFPYGGDLPANPPTSLVSIPREISAMGVECWPSLRKAWGEPQSWVRSYKWSTGWITDTEGPVQRALSHTLNWLGIKAW